MKTITIEGSLRSGFGKTATRQIRSQELVPGVIYGGVNKFIAATVENTLRYDDEVIVVKNRGESDQYNGKSILTKSFFGIGLTYKFL